MTTTASTSYDSSAPTQIIPVVRPAPPPLRIHHLMACAAVAAVQLSLWRVRNPPGVEFSATAATIGAIYQSLGAVGLTCALFSIYWHFKGYAGLAQPGQSLLLGHAFMAMELYWMVLLLWSLGPDFSTAAHNLDSGGVLSWAFMIANAVIYFGLTTFYGWCAWKIADTLPWRFTFVLLALAVLGVPLSTVLISRFGYVSNLAFALRSIIPAVVVLILETWAVADDLFSRRPRFWTHWVGIALSMIGMALSIVGGVMTGFHWF